MPHDQTLNNPKGQKPRAPEAELGATPNPARKSAFCDCSSLVKSEPMSFVIVRLQLPLNSASRICLTKINSNLDVD
jgi:hypothetical protein